MGLIILGIASIGMQVYGQIKAGQAAKKAGESQAELGRLEGQRLDYNASIAEQQATDALARGTDEEGQFSTQVRRLVGTQRAGFAGQGVDVSVGSAAEVQTDAKQLGAADLRTIRRNAQREAWGHRVEADDYRRSADVARKGGEISRQAGINAQRAAQIGAVATGVIGGSSLLLQRYGWDKQKAA